MGCCANFTLFIISFLSIGIIVAASAACVVFINKAKIKQISNNDTILIYLIIILCASAFILAFAIYASISKSRCPSLILGIILLIYSCGVIGAIVVYILFKKNIIQEIGKQWNAHEGKDDPIGRAIPEAETYLGCKGWNESNETTCYGKLNTLIKKYAIYGYIIFGVVALILFIAACIAFWKVCAKEDSLNSKKNAPLEQPLSYGW
ncbi:Tetraspanin family protein [Trichomonas vaginalis G3]|uniref:Tetraspanin family protein n=1 Tax=Trichomonas vaginalis (strain ATCC PRA-98 / G3) TaxID=412133 RepID=A2G7G6_TRIV3|nr:hypothetical protein TVAGG3_0920450 [Trichomonas vaginalis G3]EAX86900.1 Tetraspanin family protein [Trichomonas vaginalis G3]KAI5485119.1 hypothetical protein TVAGG3_0920450 [Trichomonas vaginalis G3]|eukprot:XP_001299830.1 Tetraspanin family protein [Trichomonas vaginalis G3]